MTPVPQESLAPDFVPLVALVGKWERTSLLHSAVSPTPAQMRVLLFLLLGLLRITNAAAIPVQIRDGKMIRADAPYFVLGAGGETRLPELKSRGANSFRTWSTDKLATQLAEAEKLGLTVCAGIWLEPECSWFSYRNPEHCERQLARVREIVLKHRNAPALLCWGLGNEVEGDGKNAAFWQQLERLARMVKLEDPAHPTFTGLAGITADKAAGMNEHAPSLDFVGVNTYGALPMLRKFLVDMKWTRPWMVTEYGPQGFWERPKTPWGAPLEQTSAEKVEMIGRTYRAAIRPEGGCLGSYVFLWGQKQEATATWFGLFTRAGESIATVDLLQELWTGKTAENRAPVVVRLIGPDGKNAVAPGAAFEAQVEATDPDGDKLTYRWEVMSETAKHDSKGHELPLDPIAGCAEHATGAAAKITAPSQPGNYRLFCYALDGKGHAGTANVPFQVK